MNAQHHLVFACAIAVGCATGCNLWRIDAQPILSTAQERAHVVSHLDEYLASAEPKTRVLALETLAADTDLALPAAAIKALSDTDTHVRIAALRASAVRRTPEALSAALKAARDGDPGVRLAGIAALGSVGGSEALLELRELARREGELYQAAAVTQLGVLADWPAVHEAAADKSWRVRWAAAAALSGDTSSAGCELVRKLTLDPSSQVQSKALEATTNWPLEKAGPLLLSALESRTYAPRVWALAALAKRWPPAAAISATDLEPLAPPRAKIEKLRAAWNLQFGEESLAALDAGGAKPLPAGSPGNVPQDEEDPTEDASTLRQQLGDRDKRVRLAAAKGLVRLRDAGGSAVLESLTFDLDPEIRRAAAVAIGELKDRQFMDSLIRLLGDEPAVRLAALQALPLVTGHDVVGETAPVPSASDQAQRWRDWHERARAVRNPLRADPGRSKLR